MKKVDWKKPLVTIHGTEVTYLGQVRNYGWDYVVAVHFGVSDQVYYVDENGVHNSKINDNFVVNKITTKSYWVGSYHVTTASESLRTVIFTNKLDAEKWAENFVAYGAQVHEIVREE